MGQVELKIPEEVFPETLLTSVVVIGIARGFFEQVHEQTPGYNLNHRVFPMPAGVGQLAKPVKKIGEARVNYFADSGQDDFSFFCCGCFLNWFSQAESNPGIGKTELKI
jgi:hypothetical protein